MSALWSAKSMRQVDRSRKERLNTRSLPSPVGSRPGAEMAYLGQTILSGGSYATLRDLADYGACLAFDDCEDIMDTKRSDPDKRALLLAGNRRGPEADLTRVDITPTCGVNLFLLQPNPEVPSQSRSRDRSHVVG